MQYEQGLHCLPFCLHLLDPLFCRKTILIRFEPPHDKTNRTACPRSDDWSDWADQSSLCAQWVAKDPRFLHADSEYSDQTWQMPRLIWVFAGHKGHFVGFCHEAAHFRMITAIFSGVWIFRISTVGLFTSLPKNEKTTDYMRNMYTSWHKSVNGNPTETTSTDTADTVFQLSYLWNWRKWLHYVGDLDGCLKGRWFYYIHKWDVLCDFGSCWGPKSSADNMNLRETS